MTIPVFPDVEAVATRALQADAGLQLLISDRSYTAIPARPVYPLVTVQRIGGQPPVREYLDGGIVQVEAWSNSSNPAEKAVVSKIARTARAALHNIEQTYVTLNDGQAWVTGVSDSLGLLWQPDAETYNARYIFSVRIYCHAA